MNSRLQLDEELRIILGSNNVYYQPPESVRMSYPAIVYSRSDIDNTFADDNVYFQSHFYNITVIDKNPDSIIVEAISRMKNIRYDRHYTAEGLNHDVFTIFY